MISLRNSFFVSFALHMALFGAPLFNHEPIMRHDAPKRPMVVDYVTIKEPEIKPGKPVARELELNKPIEMKAPVEANQAKTKSAAQKKEALRDARKQAEIRSSKDYISYFQFLREKIRQRLKANYTNFGKEGDISLVFVLNSDGSLSDVAIDDAASAQDRQLINIAVESVKEAAPFPGFPKALSYPKMSFNLDVSFKKR